METKLFEQGAFIKVEGPTVEGWHKCELPELLANQEPCEDLSGYTLKWAGKKLPKELIADVLALANHFPHMEVHVCLYYSTQEEKWLPHVPKQHGSSAFVEYDDEQWEAPKGYYFTGTIHTHPNIAAFWSSTDKADQEKHNGLHVVLSLKEGKLDDYLVSLSYHGKLYPQEKDLVEMPDLDKLPEAREDWLEQVKEEFQPKVSLSVPDAYKAPEGFFTSTFDKNTFDVPDEDDEEAETACHESLEEAYYSIEPFKRDIAELLMGHATNEELVACARLFLAAVKDTDAFEVVEKFLKDLLYDIRDLGEPQYLYSIAQQALEAAEEPALAEQVGAACYQAESDSADVW